MIVDSIICVVQNRASLFRSSEPVKDQENGVFRKDENEVNGDAAATKSKVEEKAKKPKEDSVFKETENCEFNVSHDNATLKSSVNEIKNEEFPPTPPHTAPDQKMEVDSDMPVDLSDTKSKAAMSNNVEEVKESASEDDQVLQIKKVRSL